MGTEEHECVCALCGSPLLTKGYECVSCGWAFEAEETSKEAKEEICLTCRTLWLESGISNGEMND